MKQFFVTGISTDVGKTIASAIIAEALEADYWKPVQTGSLEYTDTDRVKELISNEKTKFHKSSFELKSPMSPHAAAKIDGVYVDRLEIHEPETENYLVIEGSGGLLVPLNDTDTILDIIMPTYQVVVVSRNYLGSINHTLLTLNWLLIKGYDVSLIFNGEKNEETEDIILRKTGVPLIGHIDEEEEFNKVVIKKYAERFAPALKAL